MVVSEARIDSWNPAMVVKLAPLVRLDEDQLFEFCQLNRDLRIERDADGALVLMAPAGGASSARNLELCRQLGNWAQRDGSGIAFDSSVGFVLPNGALRFTPPARDATAPPLARATNGELVGRVWVLEELKPAPRDLKIGRSDGKLTQVLSGELKPGEKVITDISARAN